MNEIGFSGSEIRFLQDGDFFLNKKAVSEKIVTLLAEIERALLNKVNNTPFIFPHGINKKSGKLSRGENYNNLPYMVLDFPRLIKNDDIFLFRTVFWWGNYFSQSFILSGIYFEKYQSKIQLQIPEILKSELYISKNKKPWSLEIDADNLVKVKELSENDLRILLSNKSNLKLSEIIPIEQYDLATKKSLNFFAFILDLLH